MIGCSRHHAVALLLAALSGSSGCQQLARFSSTAEDGLADRSLLDLPVDLTADGGRRDASDATPDQHLDAPGDGAGDAVEGDLGRDGAVDAPPDSAVDAAADAALETAADTAVDGAPETEAADSGPDAAADNGADAAADAVAEGAADAAADASVPLHLWSRGGGGPNYDRALAIAVDGQDRLFIGGWFTNQGDFGGGQMTGLGEQAFLACYTASTGEPRWASQFGSGGKDVINTVAIADNGDVCIGGSYSSSITFGGASYLSAGGTDAFVACLAAEDGGHKWSMAYQGVADEVTTALTPSNDALYVTGWFRGPTSFDGQWLASSGGADAFLLRSTASGSLQWLQRFGGAVDDGGWAVAATASGDALLAATTGGADFGGGVLTSAGNADIVLARYTAGDGQHQWSTAHGGSGNDIVGGLAADHAGRFFVTGALATGGTMGGDTWPSLGSHDMVVASYRTADGAHRWSQRFGSNGNDQGRAVAVAGTDLFIAGFFNQQIDVGGGLLLGAGPSEALLARFSASDGTHRWSRALGGDLLDYGEDVALADGQLLVGGYYWPPADFGGGTLPPLGVQDVFVAAFTR